MRDVHLLELAKQIGLDLKQDIHLIFAIEDFVRLQEKRKDKWQFRIKEDGNKYWINHQEMNVAFQYPHIEDLVMAVKEYKRQYRQDEMDKNLKDYLPLQIASISPVMYETINDCKKSTFRVESI